MSASLRFVPEVHLGAGEGPRAVDLVAPLSRGHLFLITGSRSLEKQASWPRFLERIDFHKLRFTRFSVSKEPTVSVVDEGAVLCRSSGAGAVLGIGGGSVLDAAKAIAALATNGGSALDYLEAVGKGKRIDKAPLPFVAVPTTAGSGSEATKNSPLLVPELGAKRSLRSDLMVPRACVIDAELSASAPPEVAAAAGLDALTHLIESYASTGAQPTTDALALAGISRAIPGLEAIAKRERSPDAESSLAVASFWGGICLANAGLGSVHGLVAPLGGRCGVAHGVGCARLLAPAIAENVAALRKRSPGSVALFRYGEVACALTSSEKSFGAEDLPRILEDLVATLPVPSLVSLGVKRTDFAAIVKGSRAGSMKSNPIELTDDELARALDRALG